MILPLEDVVALIVCRPLGPVDTKQVLAQKLEGLGAKVATRLGKEVTHIVFQRQRNAEKQEQEAEDVELRGLFDKAAKMDFPVVFVSPLWIEKCLLERKRVMERKFTIPRPVSALFAYCKTPGSGPGKAGQKRPPRRKSVQPKAPAQYEVDTANAAFSSSQQMRETGAQNAGAAGIVREPEPHISHPPALAQQDVPRNEEAVDGSDEDFGLGTQLAAEMLTGLVDNVHSTSAQEMLVAMKTTLTVPQQPIVTPPTAFGRGPTGKRPQSADVSGRVRSATVKRRRTTSTAGCALEAPKRRAPSRLREQRVAGASPAKVAGEEGPLTFKSRRRRSERRPSKAKQDSNLQASEDVGGKGQCRNNAVCMVDDDAQQSYSDPLRGRQRSDATNQAVASCEPARESSKIEKQSESTSLSAAQRALRAVDSRLEQQMLILRTATALAQPPPPQSRHFIPTRHVRAVETPCVPPKPTLKADRAEMPKPPAVWSQRRPWDPLATPPEAQMQQMSLGSEQEADRVEAEGEESDVSGGTAVEAVAASSRIVGPTQGCLALTSVAPAITNFAKGALKSLRGLRLCPVGSESHITHLIIEQERRTLKVLLAITNGAWLLTPAWLIASLEAGCWLPEAPFQSQVRFSAAASKARRHLSEHGEPALLKGKKVCFHCADGQRASLGNVPVLKRLAVALGAKVVSRTLHGSFDFCIMVGDCQQTPHGVAASCTTVREEWLLQAVENYALPPKLEQNTL